MRLMQSYARALGLRPAARHPPTLPQTNSLKRSMLFRIRTSHEFLRVHRHRIDPGLRQSELCSTDLPVKPIGVSAGKSFGRDSIASAEKRMTIDVVLCGYSH